MHWSERYLFRRWHATDYNCWHFFSEIYAKEIGLSLPVYELSGKETLAVARKISDERASNLWEPVGEPSEFDAVLMGKGSTPTHIGIWTESDGGKIIHCNESQDVNAMTLQKAASEGYKFLQFYRHADNY